MNEVEDTAYLLHEADESRRECSLTRFNLAFLIDKDFDPMKMVEIRRAYSSENLQWL